MLVATGGQKTHDIGQDISKIFPKLLTISNDIKGIEDIRHTTASVEKKLSSLMARLTDVEVLLDYLKQGETELQAHPVATKDDLKLLWDKLKDFEGCSRHNNVIFIVIQEGKEHREMTDLKVLIPTLLGLEKKCEIKHAHRVPTQQPQPAEKPRTILHPHHSLSPCQDVARCQMETGSIFIIGDKHHLLHASRWDRLKTELH